MSKKANKANELIGKVQSRLDHLAESVDKAIVSDEMQKYLEFAARFHKYSHGNIWLIMMQRPDATQVAGYKKWNEFGRHVKKGAKGISIVNPAFGKKGTEDEGKIIYFYGSTVFDVSDTDGDPLPDIDWKSLEQSDVLLEAAIAFAKSEGIRVDIVEQTGDTQGASYGGRIELSPNAGVKTAFHEIAHEILGHKGHGSRKIKELQAEAVGFVVASHFGIEELNSHNYIALWEGDSAAIKSNAATIVNAAKKIIEFVESYCLPGDNVVE